MEVLENHRTKSLGHKAGIGPNGGESSRRTIPKIAEVRKNDANLFNQKFSIVNSRKEKQGPKSICLAE